MLRVASLPYRRFKMQSLRFCVCRVGFLIIMMLVTISSCKVADLHLDQIRDPVYLT